MTIKQTAVLTLMQPRMKMRTVALTVACMLLLPILIGFIGWGFIGAACAFGGECLTAFIVFIVARVIEDEAHLGDLLKR